MGPARSARVGDDDLAGAGVAPGDGAVGVHGRYPRPVMLTVVVGPAQRCEIERHGPATGHRVGMAELEQVVEFAFLGRSAAVRVAAASVELDDLRPQRG